MRSFKELVRDMARKPPLLFPLVGLGHIFWLLITVWSFRQVSMGIEWLQVLWLLAYTTCWLAACDLRRWGALGYLLLTLTNVGIFLLVKDVNDKDLYMSNLFLVDGIFSFFLLFFYKRFR